MVCIILSLCLVVNTLYIQNARAESMVGPHRVYAPISIVTEQECRGNPTHTC